MRKGKYHENHILLARMGYVQFTMSCNHRRASSGSPEAFAQQGKHHQLLPCPHYRLLSARVTCTRKGSKISQSSRVSKVGKYGDLSPTNHITTGKNTGCLEAIQFRM